MKLLELDSLDYPDHHYLEDEDVIYYLGEFIRAKGYKGGVENQLLMNLKISPNEPNTLRFRHKSNAIRRFGRTLGNALAQWDLSNSAFVPIPPSKSPGHPEYDNRIFQTLHHASFFQPAINIVDAIHTSNSHIPHHSDKHARYSVDELRQFIHLDTSKLPELRDKEIILVDDLLVSGTHFKACEQLLNQHGLTDVRGMFLLRRFIEKPLAQFRLK